MKRVKFTFGIIGFGCGMVTSGMIGTLLSLNIKVPEHASTNASKEQVVIEEDKENSHSKQEVISTETNIENESSTSKVSEDKAQKIQEEQAADHIQEKKDEPVENLTQSENSGVCEVIIPSKVSAGEICEILKDAGVIDDAENFLSYIKSRKKQTSLKSGQYTLPINANYEDILEALIS